MTVPNSIIHYELPKIMGMYSIPNNAEGYWYVGHCLLCEDFLKITKKVATLDFQYLEHMVSNHPRRYIKMKKFKEDQDSMQYNHQKIDTITALFDANVLSVDEARVNTKVLSVNEARAKGYVKDIDDL